MAGVWMINPNLEGADLSGASFQESNLVGVNLRNANLEGAGLVETFLDDANLEGANLRGTVWGETTSLCNASLKGAIWENVVGDPLRKNTIMPDGEVVTDEIELPDGSKIFP